MSSLIRFFTLRGWAAILIMVAIIMLAHTLA